MFIGSTEWHQINKSNFCDFHLFTIIKLIILTNSNLFAIVFPFTPLLFFAIFCSTLIVKSQEEGLSFCMDHYTCMKFHLPIVNCPFLSFLWCKKEEGKSEIFPIFWKRNLPLWVMLNITSSFTFCKDFWTALNKFWILWYMCSKYLTMYIHCQFPYLKFLLFYLWSLSSLWFLHHWHQTMSP